LIERTKRTKGLLAALAVTALVVSVAAVALAHDDGGRSAPSQPAPTEDPVARSDVPEGPYVDFCPTPEQTEAHLKQYGFDYKPTVLCTREGQIPEAPRGGDGDEDNLADSDRMARQDAEIRSSKRLPDLDNNPGTIEAELPNGQRLQIVPYTDDPERFRGMTPREFMDLVDP
jgi:hypothetical protein